HHADPALATPYQQDILSSRGHPPMRRFVPDGPVIKSARLSGALDEVPLRVAGNEMMIDAKGGHSNAMLLRFSKVATWREAFDVQGVDRREGPAENRRGGAHRQGPPPAGGEGREVDRAVAG